MIREEDKDDNTNSEIFPAASHQQPTVSALSNQMDFAT